MTKSSFDRGGSGNTQGGLDRFLGPRGSSRSKMPPALDDEKANPDEQGEVDCENKDADEPVCELKKAIDEHVEEDHPHTD